MVQSASAQSVWSVSFFLLTVTAAHETVHTPHVRTRQLFFFLFESQPEAQNLILTESFFCFFGIFAQLISLRRRPLPIHRSVGFTRSECTCPTKLGIQSRTSTTGTAASPRFDRRRTGCFMMVLTLKHFLRRRDALSLYRDVLRISKRTDQQQAGEIKHFARNSFELKRTVSDTQEISYLLTQGRRQLEQLETMLNMTK